MKKFSSSDWRVTNFPISEFRLASDDFPNRQSEIANRQFPQSGMALVVTLSLVVLVTIAVMAFFARATSNRIIEASRTNQVLSAQVADSATDYVIGQFLKEIADNSATNLTSGGTVFFATNNTFAVPQRIVLPGSSTFKNSNSVNHLRRSVNETINGVGEANASTHTTPTASANGRSVGLARWNAPRLVSGTGFNNTNQLPNWIYLNKNGSVTNTPTTNAIGRFAYNVYNIGGLLDANVAGYPSTVTGTNIAAIKGTLAGADLMQLPGMVQATIDSLVLFRNPVGGTNAVANAAAYTNYVGAAKKSGFLNVVVAGTTNNFFTSRQDLIRYATTQNPGLTNALPYLTHFTREAGAPGWKPTKPGGSTIDYAALADTATSDNRSLPGLRVTAAFTRADGTQAKVGDPLLKHRFQLSRLSAFKHNSTDNTGINPDGKTLVNGAVVPATDATILRDFGLKRVGRTWVYVGHDTNPANNPVNIKKIGGIGDREPDFFELLKAGILSGSLQTTLLGAGPVHDFDLIPDGQIFQIGANIIDQYDSDSYPTRVDGGDNGTGGTGYYFGLESLPYLNKVAEITRRYEEDEAPYIKPRIGVWFSPVVWNPHADAATLPTDAPTQFRFVMDGSAYVSAEGSFGSPVTLTDASSIKFNASTLFQKPVMLDGKDGRPGSTDQPPADPNPAIGANKDNQSARPGFGFIGISVGDVIAPDSRLVPNPTWARRYAGAHKNPGLRGKLQYKDTDGTWVNYTEHKCIPNGDNLAFDEGMSQFLYYQPRCYSDNADPRIIRFGAPDTYGYGLGLGFTSPAGFVKDEGRTARPDDGKNQGDQWVHPDRLSALAAGWTRTTNPTGLPGWPTATAYFGHLSDNLSTSPTRYLDNDGVQRPADGAYSTAAGPGRPLKTDNFASRPVILNRPFRSVADLGYASRGLPWKHLDFFSKESPDAALLDLFCVDDEPAIMAGRLSPNTLQSTVLQSVIAGTVQAEERGVAPTVVSPGDAKLNADALVARTKDATKGPLRDRAELVTQFAQDLTGAGTEIKRQREAAIRALGDVSNTRTWNLFLDVIAQSGRFLPGGTAANQFSVEGDSRTWVSVAVDRNTGRVINQSSEAVNE